MPGHGLRGRARQARHLLDRRTPLGVQRGRGRLPRAEGPHRGPAAGLSGGAARRRRDRRAAGLAGAPTGRAQGGRRPPDRGRPGRAPALRRGRRAGPREPGVRPAAAAGRARSASGGSPTLQADLHVLAGLQSALRDGEWKVTVAVHDASMIIAVWPGYHDRALGVAFDVGSTTVAGHLCDLASGEVLASAGSMNPQIRFGEDLMSRVSYVMMNPGAEGELTRVVRECLNQLVAELTAEAGVTPEDVLEATIVGNPIMHHLVLGPRPDRARGRAVRARHRRGAADVGDRDRPASPSRRAGLRAAVHRRARRRRHRGGDPVRGAPRAGRDQPDRRRRHERGDRARATASACSRPRARPVRRSRARRSRAASARRRARSSVCGSTPRRSSRGSA